MEQAQYAYELEFGKGEKADPVKLKSLKEDWDAKKADCESDEDTNVLTSDDLKSILQPMIKETIEAATLSAQAKAAVTPDAIQKAATKALADFQGKQVTLDQAKGIAEEAMKSVLTGVKMPSRFGYRNETERVQQSLPNGGSSVGEISRGHIEFPYSWTGGKSNLPVHGKQLLNVMVTGDFARMNEGIDEVTLRQAEERGQKMIEGICESAREAVIGEKSWTAGMNAAKSAAGPMPGYKALTVLGAAAGSELVAVELSSILQRRLYLESAVAALFAAREIDQPVENYLIPVRLNLPEFYVGALGGTTIPPVGGENAAATENTPGTAQPTLTAVKLMGESQYSYEIDEASIIPMLPFVEEALAQGAAHGLERAIISGHQCGAGVAGTHMDFDVTDAAGALFVQPAEKLFNGLRRLSTSVAGLRVNHSGAKADFTLFETMQSTMGIYGLNPDALVWIGGPKCIRRMKSIPQVQTIYAYGPKATIVTGRMENFDGIPVVASQWMREDVAATGVNTAGGPNTFGSCLLVRPDRFLMGRRRTFTIEIFRQPWTQTNRIIASFRRAFTPIEVPSAAIPSVVVGINWT